MGAGTVGAAFGQEKLGQALHVIVLGRRADDLPPLARLGDKPGSGKDFHMMGQCRSGNPDRSPSIPMVMPSGPARTSVRNTVNRCSDPSAAKVDAISASPALRGESDVMSRTFP